MLYYSRGGGNKPGMYFRDLMAVTFLFPPNSISSEYYLASNCIEPLSYQSVPMQMTRDTLSRI